MTAQRPLAVCAEIEAARDKSGQKNIFNERLSCCNCVPSIDLPMGQTIGFLGFSEGWSRAVPYTTQRVRADKTLPIDARSSLLTQRGIPTNK